MNKLILPLIFLSSLCCLFSFCQGIESPQFTVTRAESDFEVRLYRESWWMSAPVQGGVSFEKATKDGFQRLYQYIRGVNTNSSQIAMTAPILTSIAAKPQQPLEYTVRFYMSAKFHGAPPRPVPSLNLQLDKWDSHCAVVRKFSGFAKDNNVTKEAASLMTSLALLNWTTILEDRSSYAVAQYNSSSHSIGRLNEVWMNVTGNAMEGC